MSSGEDLAKEMARRVMLAGAAENAISVTIGFEDGWKAELNSTTETHPGRGRREQLIRVTRTTGGSGYDGPQKTETMLAMSPETLRTMLGPEMTAADLEAQRDMLAAEVATTIETLVRGDELPSHDAEGLLDACKALRQANAESKRQDYTQAVMRIQAIVNEAMETEEMHLPPNPNPLQATIDRLTAVQDAIRAGKTTA